MGDREVFSNGFVHLARTILLGVSLPAFISSGHAVDEAPTAAPCGFYFTTYDPQGAHSRYDHCADSFILIKVDWQHQADQTRCVYPRSSTPFFKTANDMVVNAYYVSTPPTLVDVDGTKRCSLTQPQV